MPNSEPKKIVYLFGAGATHAEILNLCYKQFIDASFEENNNLLMKDISRRVFRKAKRKKGISEEIKSLLSGGDLTDIELFISLIGSNRIKSEKITEDLNKLIEEDILGKLTVGRIRRFYLHKALLELHLKTENLEKLIGFITLNYDHVLDEAYKKVFNGRKPNYHISSKTSEESSEGHPLLKLHGGFKLRDGRKKIPIIAPGTNKNYLELPYNFIWGHALIILIECDILRVIGCSLNQNDIGLIDLLFKAHLARKKGPLEIQLINPDRDKKKSVKSEYGFFPGMKTLREIEGGTFDIPEIRDPDERSNNPFKIWLEVKAKKMLKDSIDKTNHIKKLYKNPLVRYEL